MKKLEYVYSPAKNFQNGYEKGFSDGKTAGYNLTIQIILETVTLLLEDAGWEQDDIQEFANRLTRGVVYNCNHPEEWKALVEQYKQEHGLSIFFSVNEALEDKKCRK